MKYLPFAIAMLSLSLSPPAAFGQKPKPKKPTPHTLAASDRPVVLGTNQLPGEFGKIGTTYTIGRERPLNFTLISAEYRADRFIGSNFDGEVEGWVPLRDQKLLVIKYSVQNPTKDDARLWYNSFEIIAVSPDSSNTKMLNQPWIGGQTAYKEVQLKPAQKVTLTGVLAVSGQGEVPKLIIQREQEPNAAVIRYDLRGKVAKIADPAFSDDGITTKETIEGKVATYYPWLGSDFQVLGVEDVSGIPDLGTPSGYKPVAIKLKFRGVTLVPGRIWYGDFNVRVTTADGETSEAKVYSRLYRGGRAETFDGVVPVGEEQTLRLIVDIPSDTSIKGVSLSAHRNEDIRRVYRFSFAD